MRGMTRRVSRSVVVWSCVLLGVVAAHDLTHAFDDGLQTGLGEFAFVAVPQWLVLAVVLAVIVRGDRAQGAAAAVLLGISVTVGLAVIHLLPFALASYWALQPSVVSWVLAWSPAVLGFALAAFAWSQWRPAARPRREVAPGTRAA